MKKIYESPGKRSRGILTKVHVYQLDNQKEQNKLKRMSISDLHKLFCVQSEFLNKYHCFQFEVVDYHLIIIEKEYVL